MLIDLHCDTIMQLYLNKGTNLLKNDYHIDLGKLKKADSLAQFFAMFVDLSQTNSPFQTAMDMIDIYHTEVEKNSDIIQTAYTSEDIMKNRENGKMSGIITLEEGGIIEGNISNLRNLHRVGVRSMTLTWNYDNAIGFPNRPRRKKSGLTEFGISVVEEMNRLGMIVDVSHLSDGGFADVLKYSTKPFLATHSNARAVCGVSRNLTDEMLVQLAEAGGATGMNFCPAFIHESHITKVAYIVDHLKHIRNIAGIDVLAMGSDFDGIGGELEVKDMSYIPLIRAELEREKFTSEEIDKIFYKNALRVIKANF